MKKIRATAIFPALLAVAAILNSSNLPKPQLPADISLTRDGKSECVIVRPDGSPFAITSACSNFSRAVKKQTGAEIKVITDKTDKYAAGAMIPREIIVGNTSRNIECSHSENLKINDFSVCAHGKDLVVAAGQESVYADAMSYITENLIKDGELCFPENFVHIESGDYAVDSLSLCGTDISDFGIVYSADFAKGSAESFADTLTEKTGIVFEAKDSADGAKNIVFGNEKDILRTEYAVFEKDGSIYVSSPTKAGLEKAYEKLSAELFGKEEKNVAVNTLDIKGNLEKTNGYAKYIRTASPLSNTYKKLTVDKKLTVAYFGGSVTVGYSSSDRAKYSWRARTTSWLADNFPEAKITEINSAIGASGSHLGAFRAQRDIIAYEPDLVFIEFSVNDTYNGETGDTASENYEAIVRSIRKAYPDCDIVNVYITDSSKASAGGDFSIKDLAHDKVAKAYRIPAVDVGKALIEKYSLKGSSSPDWKKYFSDSVHMTDEGFYEYSLVLSEFLANELLFADSHESAAHVLPEKVTAGCERELQFILPTKEMLENATGFSFNEKGFLSETPNASYNEYLETNDTNNSITLTFTGSELSLFTGSFTSGTVEYEVDGKRWKVERNSMNNPFPIVKNLKYGEHTITMKFKFKDSTVARIGAFLVR